MTENAAALPTSGDTQFYRHSGKAPPVALGAGLAAAVVLGALIGAALGAAEFVGHLIPSLKLMAVAEVMAVWGAGLLIGRAMTRTLSRFKARSPSLAYGCSLLATLIALYFAWATWIFSYMRYCGLNISYTTMVMPKPLLTAIAAINDHGSWSITKDDVPTGIFLAGIWVAEAIILGVFAVRAARKELGRKVFCEQCNAWGFSRHLMQIADKDYPTMRANLLAGRSDALSSASPAVRGSLTWCDVTLEGCPTCDNLQALSLERTVITRNRKGKATTKTIMLVRRILLTPEQTVQTALTAASISAPPPTDAPAVE